MPEEIETLMALAKNRVIAFREGHIGKLSKLQGQRLLMIVENLGEFCNTMEDGDKKGVLLMTQLNLINIVAEVLGAEPIKVRGGGRNG